VRPGRARLSVWAYHAEVDLPETAF